MKSASADQNLLFGILALQIDFIDREQLVQAMNAWVLEKSKTLGDVLCEQGHLTNQQHTLLKALVTEHLRQHDNDTDKSLASMGVVPSVRQALGDVQDDDIEQTLARVAPSPAGREDVDLYRTQMQSVDSVTSASQRFRVLRPHAKGGLGQVSVARDQELGREVALKEIQPRFADDPTSRSRFVLEAEITGGLEHPGIVPVYGLGHHEDGRPYYAMRFLRGDSLKDAIERFYDSDAAGRDPGAREVEFRKMLGSFVDVCNALEYAHSRKVLHRDLKPGNIMLGKYGETMVVDWGLAKVCDANEAPSIDLDLSPLTPSITTDVAATSMGSTIGTPPYMSPEQAAGRLDRLGPLSDIYGLGATLYHVLTGEAPFRESDLGRLLHKVQNGDFKPPRTVNPKVPRPLDAICMKAMAVNPPDRYQSAAKMASDIEHWLADEPVSAMRENWNERASRWIRRNRSKAITAATALVVVTIVAIVSMILINQARKRATDLALANEQLAEQEAEAKRRAIANLADAREAVDMWVTGGSEALKYYPALQDVRQRFLLAAALDYEKFAEQETEDLELEIERGRALVRLGDVRRLLGEPDEAKQSYHDAFSIFESHPRHEGARLELASARIQLGLLLAELAEHEVAEKAYQTAIEQLRSDAKSKSPQAPQIRKALASALLNHGVLLDRQGKFSQAIRQLQEAVQILAALVEDHARTADYRAALGRARAVLGRSFLNTGERNAALEQFQQAAQLAAGLIAASPKNPAYLELAASARMERAKVLALSGHPVEQLGAYRQAVEDYQKLEEVLPHIRSYRENLAAAWIEMGRLLHDLGRTDEAELELRAAVIVCDDLVREFGNPAHLEAKGACMDALARVFTDQANDQDAATVLNNTITLFEELATSHADVPRYRERGAVTRSHLAQVLHKLGHLDAALEHLQQVTEEFDVLIQENHQSPHLRDTAAHVYQRLGEVQLDRNDKTAAAAAFEQARSHWQALVEVDSPAAEHLNRFARFLADCADESLRDPSAAIPYAKRAHELAPENALYCNTLGLAYLRASQWREAVGWLREALRLRGEYADGSDSFLLAWALWQQSEDDDEEAEQLFQAAVGWMDQYRPGNLELARIRQEVGQLREARGTTKP